MKPLRRRATAANLVLDASEAVPQPTRGYIPRVPPGGGASEEAYDLVVIGAGFGGLGAALRGVELGARVLVLEAQNYPGGCASTFERAGARYESGATLFSGLAESQLFGRWIERHGIDVEVDWIDPLVEYRSPRLRLPVERDREALVRHLAALPGAPVERLEQFFTFQRRAADRLWSVLEEPGGLPPLGARGFARHAAHAVSWAPIARWAGKPLIAVLARFGLADFRPLVELFDAACQITVQCGVHEAEAPFALAALDYYWRGTGHVRSGIGRLADGLVRAIETGGGEVRYKQRVRCIEPDDDGHWWVHTLGSSLRAKRVVANLLPQALDATIAAGIPRSTRLARDAGRLADGWGACMLYLDLEPDAGAPPHHLQLVQDPDAPLVLGNHVYVSASGAGDDVLRTLDGRWTATVSTHVPIRELTGRAPEDRGPFVGGIHDRMRAGLRALAPELDARVHRVQTASPRTFQRYTSRPHGLVGGLPRRAGWRQYLALANGPVARGLWMVGDSVFPGQSTLATASGGVRAAEGALAGMTLSNS